ncbi:pyridoxamine 5'-phosphate oxidase family protein [Belnapia sp. T6]|uniref:Pyridoxamine 5'-phosphate oxidase family protein n=1 Tax=Belnapia mucosa TaxID=2804532 RepID=A0ABS1UXR7_9PROT|nr:pyridoxamine 5'-phosphate oxidase family protein [Belnapia mucosa]MBL6454273.1 pyridoxamine 5'-phosphate oxidase family protein [Belnapia mucosa]
MSRLFHTGNRALQDRFDGRRVADALEARRRRDTFLPEHVAMIEAAPFFFLATAAEGIADCSFKGGPPGFVRVTGPAELEFPDYDGNSMYLSLGNIALAPAVGLLFMAFDGRSLRLRLRGQAVLVEDPDRLAAIPGARRLVRVAVTDIFPNCPRYIPDLAAGEPSAYLPRPDGSQVPPEWKSRDYIRPILPADDPHRSGPGIAEHLG